MQIKLKQLVDEDFVNYKVPSMFIAFPHCTMKCGKEVCQNNPLLKAPTVTVDINELVSRYLANPVSKALVIGGLEPFDDFEELLSLVECFRERCEDPVVIYSGYYPEEIDGLVEDLKKLGGVIVKFGRFISEDRGRYDSVLGVTLASSNQYALLCA